MNFQRRVNQSIELMREQNWVDFNEHHHHLWCEEESQNIEGDFFTTRN